MKKGKPWMWSQWVWVISIVTLEAVFVHFLHERLAEPREFLSRHRG